ncbi:MAG TPA: hypothetical protein VEL03_11535 [Streptosporangiaceae bacterium]|nr:hypothetical protein [Streptosporangiaceae bacterium]
MIRPPARRPGAAWLVPALCAAVVLACAGCGGTRPPAPLGRQIGGPIVSVVTSLEFWNGRPRHLTQEFPASSPSVTATVVLGTLPGPSTLTVTWYRLTSAGAQQLISKQLGVTSDGLAYTTALVQGMLTPGTYQVRAVVDGVTRAVDWIVPVTRATVAVAARSGAPLRLGPSGSVAAERPPRVCDALRSIVSMPASTRVRFSLQTYCPPTAHGGPVRGVVLATMNRKIGDWVVGPMRLQRNGQLVGNYTLNVCSLPDGTNRPGATIWYVTLVYYHGNARSYPAAYNLPDTQSAPVVTIGSSVPAGSTVHPGEKITLRVTAAMPAGLGPQPSVRAITVDGPAGRIASRTYPLRAACGAEQVSRTVTVSYTVPAGAPPVLTFAAHGRVAGRRATRTISFRVSG